MYASDRVLDTVWELPTVETLQVTHKFSVVVLESPYIQFLSGPPDDPTSIHKSRCNSDGSKDRPYISPSTCYYKSPEN